MAEHHGGSGAGVGDVGIGQQGGGHHDTPSSTGTLCDGTTGAAEVWASAASSAKTLLERLAGDPRAEDADHHRPESEERAHGEEHPAETDRAEREADGDGRRQAPHVARGGGELRPPWRGSWSGRPPSSTGR